MIDDIRRLPDDAFAAKWCERCAFLRQVCNCHAPTADETREALRDCIVDCMTWSLPNYRGARADVIIGAILEAFDVSLKDEDET